MLHKQKEGCSKAAPGAELGSAFGDARHGLDQVGMPEEACQKRPPLDGASFDGPRDNLVVGDMIEDPKSDPRAAEGRWELDIRIPHIELCKLD